MDLNSRSPVGSDLAGIVSVLTSVADLNSRSPVGSDAVIAWMRSAAVLI